jgi:hypothetical protein
MPSTLQHRYRLFGLVPWYFETGLCTHILFLNRRACGASTVVVRRTVAQSLKRQFSGPLARLISCQQNVLCGAHSHVTAALAHSSERTSVPMILQQRTQVEWRGTGLAVEVRWKVLLSVCSDSVGCSYKSKVYITCA